MLEFSSVVLPAPLWRFIKLEESSIFVFIALQKSCTNGVSSLHPKFVGTDDSDHVANGFVKTKGDWSVATDLWLCTDCFYDIWCLSSALLSACFTCPAVCFLLWPITRLVCILSMGASQLVTRSTRHTVKSCDVLTVVSDGVVSNWP